MGLAVVVALGCTGPAPAPAPEGHPPAPEQPEAVPADAAPNQPKTWASTARRVPRARVRDLQVGKPLDPDRTRRFIRGHINEFRRCYGYGLARDPKLTAVIEIRFTLGTDGNATDVSARTPLWAADPVAGCMEDALRRWTFPMSGARQPVRGSMSVHVVQ